MSIRKHFTPDFKDLVKILIEKGFKHLDMYAKAEALIGDSHTNALINVYHKSKKDKTLLDRMEITDRKVFFEIIQKELIDHSFDRAYGVAIYQYIEKLHNEE